MLKLRTDRLCSRVASNQLLSVMSFMACLRSMLHPLINFLILHCELTKDGANFLEETGNLSKFFS